MNTDGLFSGLRLVELGQGVGAAYCAKLFADLGAEVIKVEPPEGDVLRRRGPFAGDEAGPERSGLFAYMNTSKLGVTLDVRDERGRALFLELLRDADVLVENNAPAWMREAGLGYQELAAANPELIVTSITPFGQDGPWRDYAGNDFIVQHTSGVAFHNGARARDLDAEPPFVIPGDMAETLSGMAAAPATLCALYAGDGGAHVDVAMQEVLAMHLQLDVVWVTYGGQVPSRSADARPPIPYVAQQPVADGYIDFVVRTEGQWHKFLEVLDSPEWGENPLFADMRSRSQYWDALEPLVQQETQRFKKQELFRRSQAHGVSAAAVHTVAEAAQAEHFADRGSFAEIEHPVIGRTRCPGAPVRFAGDVWRPGPAPLLGQHNREVFVERLGRSDAELAALREAGVV
jgi:crotonobetainyl-CoA:carnitine CoA-transferase CaiB-like acyl-CoA transferase